MTHDPSVQTGNEVTESVTSGASLTPTHDPLCPAFTSEQNVCACGALAALDSMRVKKHSSLLYIAEREKSGVALACDECNWSMELGYGQSLSDALEVWWLHVAGQL
jgi:hypothetical protein